MWRDDAYLLDMLLAAQKIQRFASGVDWQRFSSDELIQDAIVHCIQVIGQAASKVSKEYQQTHSQIPWREIIGMRNRIVHEYFRVIPEQVWDVVIKDIPALIKLLMPLIPPKENI